MAAAELSRAETPDLSRSASRPLRLLFISARPQMCRAALPRACLPRRSSDSTIAELKQHLQATYPGLPAPSSQRLIFEGRLLGDDERLREVLASSRLPASEPRRMHLAIRGQSATTETHTSADDGTPKSSQQNQRPSSSTPPLPSSSPPRLTNHLPAQHPAILAPQPAHTSAMHTYGSNGVYGYPYAPAAYQYPPLSVSTPPAMLSAARHSSV